MPNSSQNAERVVVRSSPPAAKNPYLSLLGDALTSLGASVVLSHRPHLRQTLRADPTTEMIHIHWPELIVGSTRPEPSLSPYLRSAHLLLTLTLARSRGMRVVWTIHNLAPHEPRRPRLDKWLGTAIARLASSSLAHSEHAANLASEEFRHHRIEVAYHPNYIGYYPPGEARNVVRDSLRIPQDAYVFLAFGLVRAYKQLPTLIDEFRRLDDQNVRLIVAGEPRHPEDRTQVIAAAGGDSRVVLLLERIPDEAVASLHQAADVGVLAYRDVFSSGALMLALSCGLPVISPAGSTATELADAPVVQPFQPRGLREALRMSADFKSDTPSRALDTAMRFTWADMAGSVLGAQLNAKVRPAAPSLP